MQYKYVTESQTASSFLQLLTNALHDQHQIYDFISQNKTIMAALVRNGFQRCWGDEQKKESNYKILYQSRQCPKGQKIQQPNQSKGSVQMQSYSQLKSKGLPNNVASLYAHSRARTH